MSQVHFPDPVDFNDPHMLNCSSVVVAFTDNSSTLMFYFNYTSSVEAKNNADAMIPSMNSAFDITFVYQATYTFPYVVVHYSADAKSDMAAFLATLKTECISPDVQGFSEVLPTLFTHAEERTITLMAVNYTTSWYNTLVADYETAYPEGTGQHTVDILYYLGVSSLQPSSYSLMGGYYFSLVSLSITSSSSPITFVSCQPPETSMPYTSSGWFIPEKGPTDEISGTLYFGNDPSAREAITFTFEGSVIPELNLAATMLLMILVSALTLSLNKRRKMIK
jgi:hypothetical protein